MKKFHFVAQSVKCECTSIDGKIECSQKSISLQYRSDFRPSALKLGFKLMMQIVKCLLASLLMLYLNIKRILCLDKAIMQNIELIEKLLSEYPEQAAVSTFSKPKRDGIRKRTITAPNPALRAWLQKANALLNKSFGEWPDFMYGGIKKRSFVSHAKNHLNQRCVITVDIKDCFDSITVSMTECALQKHLALTDDSASGLAAKLCYREKLAQGFATSNFICNLYLLEPLISLNTEFGARDLSFSNYVDDLAISGDIKSSKDSAEIIDRVFVILSKHGLKLNKDGKIQVMPNYTTQKVCGLKVNKRLTVTREYLQKQFRRVAENEIEEDVLKGVIAHLKNVDPKAAKKLYEYALQKERIKPIKKPASNTRRNGSG